MISTTLRKLRGLTTVEFAVVSVVVFLVLFTAVEFARAMFVRAILEEGARRAARLGVVSSPDASTIAALRTLACFGENSACATFLPGLAPSDIDIRYLDHAGTTIAAPATEPARIRHVQVEVSAAGEASYRLPLLIPFVEVSFPVGAIVATQPVQSLGVNP